jgi:hypothetical protein
MIRIATLVLRNTPLVTLALLLRSLCPCRSRSLSLLLEVLTVCLRPVTGHLGQQQKHKGQPESRSSKSTRVSPKAQGSARKHKGQPEIGSSKSTRVSPKAAKVAAPRPQMSAFSGTGGLAVRNAVVPDQTAAVSAVPENLSSQTSLSWA